MKDLFERLTIIIKHLKLAEQAVEEGDHFAARSFIYNAQGTNQQSGLKNRLDKG